MNRTLHQVSASLFTGLFTLALATPVTAQNSGVTTRANAHAKHKKKAMVPSPAAQHRDSSPPSATTQNLFSALMSNNLQMAEILLQDGADINCTICGTGNLAINIPQAVRGDGLTPTPELVWILDHGANPNARYRDQKTPIMLTISKGINPFYSNSADMMLLLDRGANPNAHDDQGMTPLHVLAETTPDGLHPDPAQRSDAEFHEAENRLFHLVLDKFLQSGADINARTNDGQSPLMFVARACNQSVLEKMLNAGADPHLKNNKGETALSIAMQRATESSLPMCNNAVLYLKSHVTY